MAAEATPPLDIPVLQGTILYHSLEVLVSETWWTLVPYRPFYKLYSIPKAQKLSANIPKSLFLKELLSPNGTVTALLEQLESYLKSLRSFLSAWLWASLQHAKADPFVSLWKPLLLQLLGKSSALVLTWHLPSSHTLIQVFSKGLSLALFPFLLPSIPWQSFTISSFQ